MPLPVSCQTTLQGHSSGVSCVTISPDGRMLANGSVKHRTIQVWSLPERKVLTTLQTSPKSSRGVMSIAISPDGRMLASGCTDGTVELWSLPQGTALGAALQTLEDRDLYLTASRCLTFSADGRFLAGAGRMDCEEYAPWQPGNDWHVYNAVCIWRLSDGVIHRFVRLDEGVLHGNGTFDEENTCVVFDPDLRVRACGKRNGTVGLWRWTDRAASHMWRNGEAITSRKGHTDEVTCVAMSPNKRLLVSGSKDTTIRLWKRANGRALHTLEGHTGPVSCVAISPDGRILASGSQDATVRLWRLPNGKALHILEGHTKEVTCVAMSPDGQILASGSSDGTVRVWAL